MAKWTQFDDELVFYIRADRFLRNMVRAIVGSLLEVGQGKINLEDFKKIIESKNRSNAGVSVPGHALYLVEVGYKYINN
jgi:tRNA pseudouridine38-40 synthase